MRVSKSTQPTPLIADAGTKAEGSKKAEAAPTFDTDTFVSSQRNPDKDVGSGSGYGTGYRSSGSR